MRVARFRRYVYILLSEGFALYQPVMESGRLDISLSRVVVKEELRTQRRLHSDTPLHSLSTVEIWRHNSFRVSSYFREVYERESTPLGLTASLYGMLTQTQKVRKSSVGYM